MNALATCMTLSLFRFETPQSYNVFTDAQAKPDALYWSTRVDDVHTNGSMTQEGNVCCTVGLFKNEMSADSVLDTPEKFIQLKEAPVETMHLKLSPYLHRGEINWLNKDEPGEIFQASPEQDHSAPIVVMTSAAFHDLANTAPERIAEFVKNTAQVREEMNGVDGVMFRALFSLDDQFVDDGITISAWRDQRAMLKFAYNPSAHKSRLDRHLNEPIFDRSSFTRLTIDRALGTWDGRPLVID